MRGTEAFPSGVEVSQSGEVLAKGECYAIHVSVIPGPPQPWHNDLYSEAAHDPPCDAEEWNAVANDGQSASLMFKTIADPLNLPTTFY